MSSQRNMSALLATMVFWAMAAAASPALGMDQDQRLLRIQGSTLAPAVRDVGTVFGDVVRPEELSGITGLGGSAATPELEQQLGVRLWDEWSRRQGAQAPRHGLDAGQIYLNGQRVR